MSSYNWKSAQIDDFHKQMQYTCPISMPTYIYYYVFSLKLYIDFDKLISTKKMDNNLLKKIKSIQYKLPIYDIDEL